jgi:hypothetical protein
MAAKKRRARKRVTKARRARKSVDRVQVAKRAMPKWVVVDNRAVDVRPSSADAATPPVEELQRKYRKNSKAKTARSNPASASRRQPVDDDRGGLVMMRPTGAQDPRGKTLSVFVDKGKVKGVQG